MLRAIANISKSSNCQSAVSNQSSRGLTRSVRILFSTNTAEATAANSADAEAQSETLQKTFEEKQEFFNRFSNAYVSGYRAEENVALQNQLKAHNYSRQVVEERLIKELKAIYGKNYEKVLNKRFALEIQGHRDGNATGEFELFPQNLSAQGKFKNISVNADLVNALNASNFLNLNEKQTHTHVVPVDSHFSLLLDEYTADEYVQELDDNQACLFGFPKSVDEADIIALLQQNNVKYNNIAFGECVLSLPAYAVLTFNSAAEAQTFKQHFNAAQHTIDRRVIQSATFEDSRNEHGRNRSLLVSGFSKKNSLNELVNILSAFGSVMHLEIVEEPLNEALPTTEQVLEYLKKTVPAEDNSIIYEITDTSSKVHKTVEYPPYNPEQIFMRDGKKVSEVEDEIEIEKLRGQELAKRELIPRLVINTWDADVLAPAEYKSLNKSPEQKKLFEAVQNEIRHDFQNKQYLFVTYVCRQQTEIAHQMINSTGVYQTVLKKSTEHYHCDTAHQTSVFKEIKDSKRVLKGFTTDEALISKEQDDILAQSHEEMRQNLIDAASSNYFSSELSALLEKEVIGSSKHGFEHQIHLKNNKAVGREFSTKITKDDLHSIANQLQEKQRQNISKLESLAKDDEAVLNLYRAKVMNADFNKATHPYALISESEQEQILQNIQEQGLGEYKQRQKEFLIEEQIKQRWVDKTKEILENKFSDLPRERRHFDREEKEQPKEPKEIKEKEEKDQYYSPATEYSLDKKMKKYQRYVSEMQSLYDGEYTEAMKDRIFRQAGAKCTDVDGNAFVTEQRAAAITDSVLTDQQKADIKYYNSIYDVLPKKKITDLMNQFKTMPDETMYMLTKLNLPAQVFDRSTIASDVNSDTSNEELAQQLNRYVAGLGEVYEVQKDARGEEKIVKYENEPHPVPLNALNIDEIAMLRDCLTTYGFDAETTEKEIQYFLKHGDYSEEVHKIVADVEVDPEAELEQLMDATGLSKSELESIINLDLATEGMKVVESLTQQKEEAAFLIRMGPTRPEDLIKTKTTLRNKDTTGKFKTSVFKVF